MFPLSVSSDITLYNEFEINGVRQFQPTILRGVFWDESHDTRLRKKGITVSDKVSVVIPMDISTEGRFYLPSFEFMKLPPEEKPLYWTVAKEDHFLKQTTLETISNWENLNERFGRNNVFEVTGFTVNDFGSKHMRHFKILGK